MADTTTTAASQLRVEQEVYPEIDASEAEDHGQDETQDAMDVVTAQGYIGIVVDSPGS